MNVCSFVHQCNTFTFYFLLFVDMFRPHTAIFRYYNILSRNWCSVMPISVMSWRQPCASAYGVLIISVRLLEYLCCLCGRHVACLLLVMTSFKELIYIHMPQPTETYLMELWQMSAQRKFWFLVWPCLLLWLYSSLIYLGCFFRIFLVQYEIKCVREWDCGEREKLERESKPYKDGLQFLLVMLKKIKTIHVTGREDL
jgi:hypothetical protein